MQKFSHKGIQHSKITGVSVLFLSMIQKYEKLSVPCVTCSPVIISSEVNVTTRLFYILLNTITIQSVHFDTSFCVIHITDIRLPKMVTNTNHNSRPTFLVVLL